MNIKHLFLSAMLLLLGGRLASAQPTCSSYFDAFETCNGYYLHSEYVFFGRVVEVEEIPSPVKGYTNPWQKATVTIEAPLKGLLSREEEVMLDGQCYGNVVKGSRYMFTAERVNSSVMTGLVSHHWSWVLDTTPPDKLAKLVNEVGEILSGVPQPRIVGRVMESGWAGNSYPAPLPIRPLSGVAVAVGDKDGKQIVTQTDDDGRYQFDQLPPGRYTVRPVMPKEGDVRANGTPLNKGEAAHVEVGDAVCSYQMWFDLEPVGSIVGRIEREKGNWESPLQMYLYRVESKDWVRFQEGSRNDVDISMPKGNAGGVINFSFNRIPEGLYVLSIDNLDPEGRMETLYYPLARNPREAELINVEVGKATEIAIKLPPLEERRISGRVMMPDGTLVNATVRLITGSGASAELPSDIITVADVSGDIEQRTKGGQFEFRYWEGRTVRVFAFYDGVRDGKPVRFFGRTQSLTLNNDVGPLTITLDHYERND